MSTGSPWYSWTLKSIRLVSVSGENQTSSPSRFMIMQPPWPRAPTPVARKTNSGPAGSVPVSLIRGGARSGLETNVLIPLITVLSETSFAVTFFVEQPARLKPAAPRAAAPAPFSS